MSYYIQFFPNFVRNYYATSKRFRYAFALVVYPLTLPLFSLLVSKLIFGRIWFVGYVPISTIDVALFWWVLGISMLALMFLFANQITTIREQAARQDGGDV